jgi:hypothetical protein
MGLDASLKKAGRVSPTGFWLMNDAEATDYSLMSIAAYSPSFRR